MRRFLAPLILMIALAVTACGPTASAKRSAASPSPSPSSTPSAGASATVNSTASSTPASAPGGLSCRLPLVTMSSGQVAQAGFLSFPSATFAPDPQGNVAPKGMGNGLAYDRVYNRWLPVDWRLVSDDGTHYVYATYSSTNPSTGDYSVIHVVTVATGADRVLTRTGQYVINDYSGNGVYLSRWIGGHDGPGPQIGWVLNPSSGAVTALAGGEKYGYWIAGGAGWRTDFNPADTTVHNGPTGPNRLIRVDLATGAESTWFYQQGADWVQVAGFDLRGHPIISVGVGNAMTTWWLSDSTRRTQLANGAFAITWAVGDANGIWLSDGSSTSLYTQASGTRQMASVGGEIAGGCH